MAYDEDGKLVPGVEEGLIPAKIVDPNWKPTIKFYDNREPFRKELELMSLEDFNCPISADIRTDDEIKMASQHYHNAMKSNEDTSKRFGDEDHTLAHSQQNDDGNMGISTTLTSFFGSTRRHLEDCSRRPRERPALLQRAYNCKKRSCNLCPRESLSCVSMILRILRSSGTSEFFGSVIL